MFTEVQGVRCLIQQLFSLAFPSSMQLHGTTRVRGLSTSVRSLIGCVPSRLLERPVDSVSSLLYLSSTLCHTLNTIDFKDTAYRSHCIHCNARSPPPLQSVSESESTFTPIVDCRWSILIVLALPSCHLPSSLPSFLPGTS